MAAELLHSVFGVPVKRLLFGVPTWSLAGVTGNHGVT